MPTRSMSTVRKHFWQSVRRGEGGCSSTEEVGLQRMHPGEREQRGGVVRGGHERCGGDAQVAALLEEAQELLTDLVGCHDR